MRSLAVALVGLVVSAGAAWAGPADEVASLGRAERAGAAMHACDDALAHAGEDGPLQLACGSAYATVYRLDDAEGCFLHAAELLPRAAGPLVGLARLYALRGDDARARGFLERAREVDAREAEVNGVLAPLDERAALAGASVAEPAAEVPAHAVWQRVQAGALDRDLCDGGRARRLGFRLVEDDVTADVAHVHLRLGLARAPELARVDALARGLEAADVACAPALVRTYRSLAIDDRLPFLRRVVNLAEPLTRTARFELRRQEGGWVIVDATLVDDAGGRSSLAALERARSANVAAGRPRRLAPLVAAILAAAAVAAWLLRRRRATGA